MAVVCFFWKGNLLNLRLATQFLQYYEQRCITLSFILPSIKSASPTGQMKTPVPAYKLGQSSAFVPWVLVMFP
jgi:hypothetical protein